MNFFAHYSDSQSVSFLNAGKHFNNGTILNAFKGGEEEEEKSENLVQERGWEKEEAVKRRFRAACKISLCI